MNKQLHLIISVRCDYLSMFKIQWLIFIRKDPSKFIYNLNIWRVTRMKVFQNVNGLSQMSRLTCFEMMTFMPVYQDRYSGPRQERVSHIHFIVSKRPVWFNFTEYNTMG